MQYSHHEYRRQRAKLYRAITLAEIADRTFRLECIKLGLDYETAVCAPLDFVAEAIELKKKLH